MRRSTTVQRGSAPRYITLAKGKRTLQLLEVDEFMSLFDPSVHDTIKTKAREYSPEYLVCFENLDMCSSRLGERTCLCVGPNNSVQVLDNLPPHINDLPSMRQYPVCVCKVPTDWLATVYAT